MPKIKRAICKPELSCLSLPFSIRMRMMSRGPHISNALGQLMSSQNFYQPRWSWMQKTAECTMKCIPVWRKPSLARTWAFQDLPKPLRSYGALNRYRLANQCGSFNAQNGANYRKCPGILSLCGFSSHFVYKWLRIVPLSSDISATYRAHISPRLVWYGSRRNQTQRSAKVNIDRQQCAAFINHCNWELSLHYCQI